jgi:4-hydroxymandelate oxidase
MTRPEAFCVADFEALAAAVLDPAVRDFVAGGSGDELTLRRNREALDDVPLLPRVLSGVASPDTGTELLGARAAMPVAVAPMAYQRLCHPDGEVAAATAARAAGVPFVVSTLSSQPLEEIAATGATTWFQLYWLRDRGLVADLVRRAEDAGCAALVVTVDVPAMGARLRDRRNSFALPPDVVAANLPTSVGAAHHARDGASAVAAHTSATFDPAVTWTDLARLRTTTTLPLVVKGILHPRDADRAVRAGADAVVVSNHGGRQLDGAAASATALPGVVEAVAGRCEVLLDSGIRSGLDVLRALALGASAVLLGRPVLWALAADGERGVRTALRLLHEELRDTMLLAGCSTTAEAHELLTHVR